MLTNFETTKPNAMNEIQDIIPLDDDRNKLKLYVLVDILKGNNLPFNVKTVYGVHF